MSTHNLICRKSATFLPPSTQLSLTHDATDEGHNGKMV